MKIAPSQFEIIEQAITGARNNRPTNDDSTANVATIVDADGNTQVLEMLLEPNQE